MRIDAQRSELGILPVRESESLEAHGIAVVLSYYILQCFVFMKRGRGFANLQTQ